MTFVNFDNLWTLMSKYELIPDSESMRDDLSCLICKKLMIDSFQSGCGCQYCHKCIREYLERGDKLCLGSKKECKEESLVLNVNVLRSAVLNRKVSKLKVHCPIESCRCIEELSRMESHLGLCMKETEECPYTVLGCDNKEKGKISTHLSEDALHHTHLLLEHIQNIRNEVSTLKAESQNNATTKKDVDDLKMDLERTKSIVTYLKEELLDKEDTIARLKVEVRLLKDHFQKSHLQNICFEKPESEKIKIDEMMHEREVLKPHYGSGPKEEKAIERNMNVSVEELNEAKNEMGVCTHVGEVHVGETFFKVDRFSERKILNERVLSPHFYSHTKGYKLRLQVYPGGNQGGKGSHFSVGFVMCKGDYDDLLPWPCKHSIEISLIDQSTQREHYTRSWNHSTTKEHYKYIFCKPNDDKNLSFGCPKFFPLEYFQSVPGLSLNDVVVIKCSVTAPS